MATTLGNTVSFGGEGGAAFTAGALATCFVTGATAFFATGLATALPAADLATGLAGCFAGALTGALATGLATFLATGAAAFFGATLTAAGLTGFLTAAAERLATGLATGLTMFGLAATGRAAAFFATGALTAAFFAAGGALAALFTDFDTAGFAAFLDATFTDFPPSAAGLAFFVSPALDAPVLAGTLATAELRVDFAISFTIMVLAAGCYSPDVLPQQPLFWNTRTVPANTLHGNNGYRDPAHPFPALLL